MIYEADSLTDWGYQLNQKIHKAMQELVESIGSDIHSSNKPLPPFTGYPPVNVYITMENHHF